MPTASGACTFSVCKIIHWNKKDENGNPLLKIVWKQNGHENEKETTNESDIVERFEKLSNYAKQNNIIQKIELYTDLSEYQPSDNNKYKLVFIDTPGTNAADRNNVQNKKPDIEITEEVINSKQKEMVVLVSDDKLQDDRILDILNLLDRSVENDTKSNNRFLYVMNKCDNISYKSNSNTNSNKNSEIKESLEASVKSFIKTIEIIPNSNIKRNLISPRIFPVSSASALAIECNYTKLPKKEDNQTDKRILYNIYKSYAEKLYYGELSELKNDEDFNENELVEKNYCLEQQSSISTELKNKYIEKLSNKIDFNERIMIHSGIPALKSAISEYIQFYAYPIKIQRLLDCFEGILEEIKTINDKQIEELEKAKKDLGDAVSLERQNQEREREIEEKKSLVEDAKKQLESIKKEINEIKDTPTELNNIRGKIFTFRNSVAQKKKIYDSKNNANIVWEEIKSEANRIADEVSRCMKNIISEKNIIREELYDKFISQINKLEEKGLLSDGKFNFKNSTFPLHFTIQKMINTMI